MVGWVVLAAAVGGVWYAAHCWWWPFGNCRKCDGAGRFRSASGRAWRPCRRCKGSGSRVRFGRRLLTWASKKKNDAIG